MTRRQWAWFVAAYLILVAGAVVTARILQRQTDRLDRHTKALEHQTVALQQAAGVFCEVTRLSDRGEVILLRRVANGGLIRLSPECRRLIRSVYHGHPFIEGG